MTSAIRLSSVGKTFTSKKSVVEALQDVALEVAPGEFISIVGTSGCGKSTLLRIVAGLIRPTSGEVRVNDRPVDGPHDDIGIVFQTPVLLPWRSVWRNVSLQLELRGIDGPQHHGEIARLLELTGLRSFEAAYPYQLSGGMQQRVALCRALVHNPKLLLMDEPFGALDALTRESMNSELQRVWLQTNKTVLFITHSITEAVFLSDRIAVMSARPGRVKEIVEVRIPRPRGRDIIKDPEFFTAVDRIRTLMDAAGTTD